MWMKAKKAKMRTFQYIAIVGLVFTLSGCALLPVEEEALKPPGGVGFREGGYTYS